MEAHGRDVRKGYLELLGRWLDEVRRAAAESDVDYVLVPHRPAARRGAAALPGAPGAERRMRARMSLRFLNPALLWGLAAAASRSPSTSSSGGARGRSPSRPSTSCCRPGARPSGGSSCGACSSSRPAPLLLAAAALAIARPARSSRRRPRGRGGPAGPAATVIVLDASASMAYRLGGGTLFDRAREDALEVLASLGPDEPATVVVCGGGCGRPRPTRPASTAWPLRRRSTRPGRASPTPTSPPAWPRRRARSATRPRSPAARAAGSWSSPTSPPAPGGSTRRRRWCRRRAGRGGPEVALLDAARGETLPNRCGRPGSPPSRSRRSGRAATGSPSP